MVAKLRRMADYISEEILHVTLQRFEFGIGFADDVRFRFDSSTQIRTQADQVNHLDALQPFQKDDHVAIRHFDGLVYSCQGANLVQVSRRWILYARIELRNHSEHLLFAL